MGDVVSLHLDESKREMITGHTRQVMRNFQTIFEQQYAVALFNSVRAEIEGTGGTRSQLLHRKNPLEGRTIFSGSLLQHVEENRKWKNRYVSIPDSYTIDLHDNKAACDRGLQPKVRINCSGYKVLTSLEEYQQLISNSLPGVTAKAGPAPFVKTATQYPLVLWHPFARHHFFCVLTEKEHSKWSAVLQDCVRHANNGLPDENTVETPAFSNSVRLYRQAQGHYGSWDLMCGTPPQILSSLVMEELHPDLRSVIGPRLKGKLQQRQRSWMLISGAVYRQVLNQTTTQYEALLSCCEAQKGNLDADLRTNMDQIITSKEHVSNKIKAAVLPKAEQLLRSSVQPCVSSLLEALMEPTSRGFSEVREVFSTELVELSKDSLNQDQDRLREMERVSMLAFHPVKMRSCYEQLERMDLEGLQQRFNMSGPSVLTGRAQILMREQMDNAVYTFEQLLNQSVEAQGEGDLCQSIQKCQDRVLKKFDYDSSTVRKKFFREALLQIIVPYMLQQLAPSCSAELPRFQEMIFEDFSRFLLVENLYEEVVIQSVSKDVTSAIKEAAAQRRHNLYRDSIVLTNSDPNLHLLDENESVDRGSKFSAEEPPSFAPSLYETCNSSSPGHKPSIKGRVSNYSSKRRQVVSMIQLEGVSLPYESCLEVPDEDLVLEEEEDTISSLEEDVKSPDSINQIRGLINPVVEVVLPVPEEEEVTNGTEFTTGKVVMEDGMQEEVTHVTTLLDKIPRSSLKIDKKEVTKGMEFNAGEVVMEDGLQKEVTHMTTPLNKVPRDSLKIHKHIDEAKDVSPTSKMFIKIEEEDETLANTENSQIENFLEPEMKTCPPVETKKSPQSLLQQLMGSKRQEEEAAIKRAIHELDIAVEGEEDSDQNLSGHDSDSDLVQPQQIRVTDYSSHDDSGFQSPTNERPESDSLQPIINELTRAVDPADVEVMFT